MSSTNKITVDGNDTKPIATITGENDETITISLNGDKLFAEFVRERAYTYEVGSDFASEEAAADYIHDSWGRNWNLTWLNA